LVFLRCALLVFSVFLLVFLSSGFPFFEQFWIWTKSKSEHFQNLNNFEIWTNSKSKKIVLEQIRNLNNFCIWTSSKFEQFLYLKKIQIWIKFRFEQILKNQIWPKNVFVQIWTLNKF
jgi:hypothetical protein